VGLTGTIAMFSLVNGVLLSPLPVRAEHELVFGWRGLPQVGARQWPFTSKDLELLRRESRTLEGDLQQTSKGCCCRSFDVVRQERLKARLWLGKSSRSIEQPGNRCNVVWRTPSYRLVSCRADP
jgi:hypothetical protein